LDDLKERTLQITNGLKYKTPIIADFSTEPGLYCNGRLDPICEYTNDPNLLFAAIINELSSNPSLTPRDFNFVSNSVNELLREAKDILLEKILRVKGNPLLSDKEKVINNMGEALDIQLGRDLLVKDKGFRWIIDKLNKLSVDKRLVNRYEALHDYYLATKHRDNSKFTKSLKLLGSVKGRLITKEFFETVREILQNYYVYKGYKLPKELAEVDYSKYDI